ncbi:MAG: hypothetical protein IJU35_06055 [Paludibacteraceae bacterium]|nr:hypothetical protein [Paludibacteraceae bacterium]
MKKILPLLVLLMVSGLSFAGKRADRLTNEWRYELECAGNGAQGTYLVKVWSYSKNSRVAYEQCSKNAVHGIIFKGYAGGNGCTPQRPLCSNPGAEQEYADFFKRFFADGGEYMKYVQVKAASRQDVKIKSEHKVGVVVSVAKDQLRKALEQAGVIRGLSTGF